MATFAKIGEVNYVARKKTPKQRQRRITGSTGMGTNEYIYDGAFTRRIGNLITTEITPNWLVRGLAVPEDVRLIRGNHRDPNKYHFEKTFYTGWKGFDNVEFALGGNISVPSPHTSGQIGSIQSWGGCAIADDLEKVKDRLASKIQELMEHGVDISTDVYEWKQTYKLVKGLTHFRKTALEFLDTLVIPKFKDYKNSKGSRSQRAMDYITQAWLAERYGVTPLMHSIHGIIKELNRVQDGRPITVKVRSGFKKYRNIRTGRGTYADPWVDTGTTCNTRGQWIITFDQAVLAPGLDKFFTQSFPVFAWETYPFSFVFDWFVNIGKYLKDLEERQGLNRFISKTILSTGWKKQEFRQVEGISQDPFYYWPSGAVIDYSGRQSVVQKYASCSQTMFDRKVDAYLPLPRLPEFRPSLSSNRLLDACALMWQVTKKSRDKSFFD